MKNGRPYPNLPVKPDKVKTSKKKLKRFEVWELVAWLEAEDEAAAKQQLRDSYPASRAFRLREYKS